MFTRKVKVSALATLATVLSCVGATRVAVAANPFIVDYRLPAWKTAHFDDVKGADAHFAAVTKLGCQTKKGSHDGHYDVSYTCPQWRRIALESHDDAHQWENWLKAKGFETKHAH